MTKQTTEYSAIHDSGLFLPGTLYLLQQLNQRGELRNRDIMNKDIYHNGAVLSDRLKRTQKHGLVKRNVKNIPGEQTIITYVLSEYGEQVIPLIERIEEITQKAKNKLNSY
jgi:DNA-binding HxlR family transcriptional regulator